MDVRYIWSCVTRLSERCVFVAVIVKGKGFEYYTLPTFNYPWPDLQVYTSLFNTPKTLLHWGYLAVRDGKIVDAHGRSVVEGTYTIPTSLYTTSLPS